MGRVVIVLSPLAKAAAGVLMVGVALGFYGKFEGVRWAWIAGTVAVCAGGAVYYIERVRMWRRSKTEADR